MNGALVIPDPGAIALSELVARCRSVYEHRDEIVGRLQVQDAAELLRRVSAVETYLRAKEGQTEARRACRVVELAVGAALGPARLDHDRSAGATSPASEVGIHRQDRHRFRRMFEHRDCWEPMLADKGMTRAEVLRTIDDSLARKAQHNGNGPVETCTADDLGVLVNSGHRFGTIYADPPWLYDNQGTRAATGNHYKGLTVDELCELPVRELAKDDAHLHLWTTNAFLFDCPRIFDAWGFEFRSSFVWVKPQMGIGNYWRNSHEFLLTAIRGDAKRFNSRNLKSWAELERTQHSAKPEAIRKMIELASPAPFLELFGRRVAEQWVVWGNEIVRTMFDDAVVSL